MEKRMDFLRRKLYKLLKNNATFREVYKVSVQLDRLIVIYYKRTINRPPQKDQKYAV